MHLSLCHLRHRVFVTHPPSSEFSSLSASGFRVSTSFHCKNPLSTSGFRVSLNFLEFVSPSASGFQRSFLTFLGLPLVLFQISSLPTPLLLSHYCAVRHSDALEFTKFLIFMTSIRLHSRHGLDLDPRGDRGGPLPLTYDPADSSSLKFSSICQDCK